MENIVGIGLVLVLCVCMYKIYTLSSPNEETEKQLNSTLEQVGKLKQQLNEMTTNYTLERAAKITIKEAYEKLNHQKKSSEVKTGFMAEALLPITDQFPCDPKSMRFLGAPIDYVSFDYEKEQITFIEVKTGDSQLNDNQRKVRDIIEKGNVKFVVVRLNENGIKVK